MADEKQTVTVTDLNGNEVEVPVGLDGENPVSPNNPPLKAVDEAYRKQAVAQREAELKHAEAISEVAGTGDNSVSTNMEDNNPGENVDEKGDLREGVGEKATTSRPAKKAASSNADTKKD